MRESWLIVLAPESELPPSYDLESMPPVPAEKVEKALEVCRVGVEPFEMPAEGLRFVPIEEGANPLDIARVAEALACQIGPVTIVDADFTLHVEVKGGTQPDQIVAELADSLREREEQVRAFEARPRVSLDPPAFAPGRPDKKRFLPPIKTTLTGAFILCWAWLIFKEDVINCGPSETRMRTDPRMDDTSSAFMYAHLVMTSRAGRQQTPEGWIEVPADQTITHHMVGKAKDGKTYVCDAWRNPIRCIRTREGFRYSSFGPNGKDEAGRGDDIVKVYPSR